MNITAVGYRSSFRRPVRTLLSIVGIALGVTLILTVSAVSTRYSTIVGQTFSIYNSDLVVVSKASLLVEGLPLGGTLPDTVVPLVKAVPGVTSATPILLVVDVNQVVPANITIGVPLQNFSMFKSSQAGLEGTYPTSNNEAILGGYLAGVSNLTVGSTILVGGNPVSVSGLLMTSNVVLDDSLILPLPTAQADLGYEGLVSAILVDYGGVQTSTLEAQIQSKVPGATSIVPSQSGLLSNPLAASVGAVSSGIDAFSILLALLFISIVSIANLTEQGSEFSTMSAMGSPSTALVKIALAEVGLISLVGAVVGAALGLLSTTLIFQTFSTISGPLAISTAIAATPLSTLLATVGATVGLGLLLGGLTAMVMVRRMP